MTTATKQPDTARLQAQYLSEIRPQLQKEFKLKNIEETPKLEKVILNVGLGKQKDDKKQVEQVKTTIRKITGQEPITTHAKKAIASFKLREGQVVGLKVTLRGKKMFEFIDRLATIVLPRVRDFHGIPKNGFDKQGNYSLGLIEQSVFPELSYEDTVVLHGIQIVFVIKSKSAEHSQELLSRLGLPFEKEQKK